MNNPYHQVPFNTGLSVNEMEDLVDQSGKEIAFFKNFEFI